MAELGFDESAPAEEPPAEDPFADEPLAGSGETDLASELDLGGSDPAPYDPLGDLQDEFGNPPAETSATDDLLSEAAGDGGAEPAFEPTYDPSYDETPAAEDLLSTTAETAMAGEGIDLGSELGELFGAQSAVDDLPQEGGSTELGDAGLADIFKEFKKGVDKQLGKEDYDTRYNLGIAYKEMGLIDEAIAEFQLAAKDEARVLECSSMLGICFLEKGMPKLAMKWFEQAGSRRRTARKRSTRPCATTWPPRSRPPATSTRPWPCSPTSTARTRTSVTWRRRSATCGPRSRGSDPRQRGRRAARDAGVSELLAVALSVLSSILVGILLAFVPWTGWWDSNYLLQPYPSLRAVRAQPVRAGDGHGARPREHRARRARGLSAPERACLPDLSQRPPIASC